MAKAGEQREAQSSESVPLENLEAGREPPSMRKKEHHQLIYPDLAPVVFLCLPQTSRLRRWCIKAFRSPWLDLVSLVVILLSCVNQGSYQPGREDTTNREGFEVFALVYFMVEMFIKMIALGVCGHKISYFTCKWHKLDVFIISGEMLELLLYLFGVNLEIGYAVKPLRLISRVPSMKQLMSILLDTLPMLGHFLLLFMFVIHIFAVLGVSLWAGELKNRCFLGEDIVTKYNLSLSPYYVAVPGERMSFICSLDSLTGKRHCNDVPPYKEGGNICTLAAPHQDKPGNWGVAGTAGPRNGDCVNWNLFYNVCRPDGPNPSKGSINFDNIGYAWIAVFQVITLEGWTDIMYYVMDTHSFSSFVPFILMTTLGSFVLMNTCAVVIAFHFSEAMIKEREKVQGSVINLKDLYYMFIRCLDGCMSRMCQKAPTIEDRGNVSSGMFCSNLLKKIQELVNSNVFTNGIMVTIFFNIITMAVEHHEQPQEVTQALQGCNLIFTVVFAIEMVLKLIAFRMEYFADQGNLFDFAIVMISFWEVGSDSDGKLSVVRAFRVLRFVKLLHFMPHLRKQLMVLLRTMKEASTLCWLMLFFIFMFSVMGMHLFGCKFHWLADNDDVNDDRKNFDSLLWSMVTVFQILTQEDWNLVLYNGMAATSPWSALYFIAIIILGKNVLLNVLVGIVVENFQTQPPSGSGEDASLSASSSPSCSTPVDVLQVTDEPLKIENTSDLSSVDTLRNYHEENSAAINTDRDHIPLNLSQKVLRWCQRYEDWTFYVISPQNRFRVLCQHAVSHHYFDHLTMVFIGLSCITIAMERPNIDPGSSSTPSIEAIGKLLQDIVFEDSVRTVSPSNIVMEPARKRKFSPMWEHFELISPKKEQLILDVGFYVFSFVFFVEMFMKVTAWGLIFGKLSYYRCPWNMVDGSLVIISLVQISITVVAQEEAQILSILKVLRLLRAFRPLRMIKRIPKLKLAVEALMASVKPMSNIVLISCVFLFFFGILGVQLFNGKFFHCVGEDLSNIVNKSDCLAANYHWVLKECNFDNLLQALISLFVMYSKDGWVNLMYDGLDAVGVDQQPIKNYNTWMLPYFLSFMVMSFFLLDMFIGVMVETFHRCQQKQKQEDELLRDQAKQSGRHGAEEEAAESKRTESFTQYSHVRRLIYKMCTSTALDLIVTAIIIINVMMMAFEHHNQPEYITKVIDYSNYAFTISMIIEVLLKLVAFGLVRFIKDSWNLLDITIILITSVSIVLSQITITDGIPFNPNILRVCRLLKLTQVLKAKKIRVLLETVIKTLSQVGNICLLFMFFFFIYAALGVELFGKLECSPDYPCLGLHRLSNFRNFPISLLTLYKVCTGDNWSGILKDTMRKCRPGDPDCLSFLFWVSPIYFSSFVIVAQFVLANLVVATIMQALEESKEEREAQQHREQVSPSAEQGNTEITI